MAHIFPAHQRVRSVGNDVLCSEDDGNAVVVRTPYEKSLYTTMLIRIVHDVVQNEQRVLPGVEKTHLLGLPEWSSAFQYPGIPPGYRRTDVRCVCRQARAYQTWRRIGWSLASSWCSVFPDAVTPQQPSRNGCLYTMSPNSMCASTGRRAAIFFSGSTDLNYSCHIRIYWWGFPLVFRSI